MSGDRWVVIVQCIDRPYAERVKANIETLLGKSFVPRVVRLKPKKTSESPAASSSVPAGVGLPPGGGSEEPGNLFLRFWPAMVEWHNAGAKTSGGAYRRVGRVFDAFISAARAEGRKEAEKARFGLVAVPDEGHPHLVDGEFQSDKYPSCPRGKVPLSTKDKDAQPLLWQYAQTHRAKDAEFSSDLEIALKNSGYEHKQPTLSESVAEARNAVFRTEGAADRVDRLIDAVRAESRKTIDHLHQRISELESDLARVAQLRMQQQSDACS